MAEVIGIAGSIAGLVTLADMVVRKGYKYLKEVKNADATLKSIIREVNNLSGVLHSLSNVATVIAAEAAQESSSIQIYSVQRCFETLNSALAILNNELPSMPSSKSSSFRWPKKSANLKEILADIQRHKTTMSLAMNATEMSTLSELLSGQKKIQGSLRNIEVDYLERHKNSIDETKQKMLNWLGSINAKKWQDTNINLRKEGTGIWFTDGPELKQWQTEPNSQLWVHGIPGAGKTILMASVIQELKRSVDETVALAYFYCDYKDTATHDPVAILGSLARQLIVQNQNALDDLEAFYNNHITAERFTSQLKAAEVQELIIHISSYFKTTMIVVDGLDEVAINRADVARLLCDLNHPNNSIKCLFASRDEVDLRYALEGYIEVSIAARSSDLQIYVLAEITERTKKRRLRIQDPELTEQILNVLVHGAEGMFRWVACQIDYLCECSTDNDRRNALKKLPPDLPSSYERILERLNRTTVENQNLVIATLHWIVYAMDVLTTSELLQALACNDSRGNFSSGSMTTVDQLLHWCSSLVRQSADQERLEIAHFTVKEFLRGIEKPSLLKYRLYGDESILTKHCINFLSSRTFNQKPVMEFVNIESPTFLDKWDSFENDFPFVTYAAQYWYSHASNSTWEIVEASVHNLLMRCGCCLWKYPWVLYNKCDCNSISISSFFDERAPEPLHWALCLSLYKSCTRLIGQKTDINQSSTFGTPLECLLLTSVAPYCYTCRGSTYSVGYSSEYYPDADGFMSVLLTLLEAGANLNSRRLDAVEDLSALDIVIASEHLLTTSRPLSAMLKSQSARISKKHIRKLRELEEFISADEILEIVESGDTNDFIPHQLIASVVNSRGRALESEACQGFLEYVISLYALKVPLSLLPVPFNSIHTALCMGPQWKELSAVLGTDSLTTETNLITMLCTAILKMSDDIGSYVSFMEQMLVYLIEWESAENVAVFLNCMGEGPPLSTHGDSIGEKIVSRCLRILLLRAQFDTIEETQRIMDIAELMVLRGADILSTDEEGNSPLSLAIKVFEMREFERLWDCACCGSDRDTVETLEKATNLLQEGSSSDSISNILIVVGKVLDMEPGLVDMVVQVFLPQTNRLYLEPLLKYAKSGTLDCETGYSGSDDDRDDDDSDSDDDDSRDGDDSGDDDGTNSKDFDENMSDTKKEYPFSWSLSILTAMICAAAKSSDWDTFGLVLDYTGPLAGRNSAGMTALHVLAELQDELPLAKLNAILDTQNPLDICDSRDQHNFTPLMRAAHYGNVEAVKQLLNAGADSTMTEDHGYNALHIAAFQGQEACAAQLLFYCADLKSVSKYGSTPLLSSAYTRQWNMVRYFLRRSDIDPTITDFQGISLVHYLSQVGGEEILETLIKQRPDLNLDLRDDRGITPLLIAIQHNNMKARELLISHGVARNYKFPAQYLVLLSPVTKEQRLLKYELDWLARNTIYTGSMVIGNATALHLATNLGHINMLLFILEQNLVDINSCAADGVTPLHISIMEDLGVCFDILLNFGADINLRTTNSGVDCLQLAEHYNRSYMLDTLREKGRNSSQAGYHKHKLRENDPLDDLGNFIEEGQPTTAEEINDISSEEETDELAEAIFSQHNENMDQDSAISASLPLRERNHEITPTHSSATINESTAEIPLHRTMVYRLQPVDTEEANEVLNSLESRAANEEQTCEHYVETLVDMTYNKQSHEHYQIETHAENKVETYHRQTDKSRHPELLTKDTPDKPSHGHQPAPAIQIPSTSSPPPAYMIWTPTSPPNQDSSPPNPVPNSTPGTNPPPGSANPDPDPYPNPTPSIPPPQKNTQALPFVVVSQEGELVLRGVMKES